MNRDFGEAPQQGTGKVSASAQGDRGFHLNTHRFLKQDAVLRGQFHHEVHEGHKESTWILRDFAVILRVDGLCARSPI